jgi:hypothetical protein
MLVKFPQFSNIRVSFQDRAFVLIEKARLYVEVETMSMHEDRSMSLVVLA